MQRRSDALWLAVIVFLTSISIGNADVLVSESFDYDPGPIDGQDGGDGWGDIWLTSETLFDTDFRLDVFEPETPLVYAFPEGGFANGGDRALIFSNDDPEAVLANETMGLTRDLDTAIDLDEVYFSFLYRYEGDGTETGGFINDNDFVVWWFNSAGGPQAGLKGNFGDGSAPDDFVGRVSGAFAPPQQAYAPGVDISAEAGTLNDTWLVVGKMSKGDNSLEEGDYDQFDLWINPGLTESDPLTTATGAEGDALEIDLVSIGLRLFNEEPGDKMSWDELRLGETWEDVVGVFGDQDVVIEQPTCEVPTGAIPGDLDGDDAVGFSDFLILSGNFGGTDLAYEEGDIDCDGEVAFADFLTLSGNFGQSAAGAQSVPEPSSIALLGWVLLFGLKRRRR